MGLADAAEPVHYQSLKCDPTERYLQAVHPVVEHHNCTDAFENSLLDDVNCVRRARAMLLVPLPVRVVLPARVGLAVGLIQLVGAKAGPLCEAKAESGRSPLHIAGDPYRALLQACDHREPSDARHWLRTACSTLHRPC